MPTLSAPNSATYTTTVPQESVQVVCTGANDVMLVSWVGPGGISGRRTVRNTTSAGEEIGPLPNSTGVTFSAIAGAPTFTAPAYGEPLQSLVSGARKQLGKLNFLGDSLTSQTVWPTVPRGAGVWPITSPWTNLNSVGGWISNYAFDGRAPSGASGTLETDGLGKLRFTYTGDSAGPWVDVSAGGFFEIPSATSGRGVHVAICKSQQRPTAGSDAVATGGLIQTQVGQLIVYPSWVQAALGPAVACQLWGISGDNLAGVETRWRAAVANSPDALVLLIGTNDAPSTQAACDALLSRYIALVEQIITVVPMVYIGGIFPRSDVAAGVRSLLSSLSDGLRRYAATQPQKVRYWDAYPRLANPAAADGTARTGVQHTDNLHLMPYGAQVATEDLLTQIRQDWSLPTVANKSRGLAPWDSTSRTGSLVTNPTLKGSGGTGSGSNGVTGNVPTGWTISRGASTQTCALSTVSTTDGQDALLLTVANAGAFDYNELVQIVSVPAGLNAGDYVVMEFDAQIISATNLTQLQFMLNTSGNKNSIYMLQPSRPVNVFAPGVAQPVMRMRSEPMLMAAGITSMTITLRIGGAGAMNAAFAVSRIDVLRVD